MSKEYEAIQNEDVKASLVRRLNEKLLLNEDSGCLEWTAKAVHKMGYGKISSTREIGPLRAHRLAWVLVNGEIPDDLIVMHSCDNPKCCNIKHLSLGTRLQNMQDMKSKGRHFTPFSGKIGEKNNKVKISELLAKQIIVSQGSNQELADIFQVSKKIISDIKLKKSWRYLHEHITKRY